MLVWWIFVYQQNFLGCTTVEYSLYCCSWEINSPSYLTILLLQIKFDSHSYLMQLFITQFYLILLFEDRNFSTCYLIEANMLPNASFVFFFVWPMRIVLNRIFEHILSLYGKKFRLTLTIRVTAGPDKNLIWYYTPKMAPTCSYVSNFALER